VFKVGIDIAVVTTKAIKLKQQYPDVFEGVGKLKNKQISLDINPTVKPVTQPYRRIPFNLREQVQDKTTELLDLGIIEPVDGPAPWVNPVVIIPKNNGEIRLCIDMRKANQVITRRRYPIPTIDEVLHNMNGAKVFSKLDLKWGYHQLELSPESREITTFATPDTNAYSLVSVLPVNNISMKSLQFCQVLNVQKTFQMISWCMDLTQKHMTTGSAKLWSACRSVVSLCTLRNVCSTWTGWCLWACCFQRKALGLQKIESRQC